MPDVLKQLLGSKKFLTLLAGVAVILLVTKLGWDEETATKVVGLFGMYLGSQGLADLGKGKAQTETLTKDQIEEASRKVLELVSELGEVDKQPE